MCLNCTVILVTFPKMCMQSVHSGPGQPLSLKREGIPALSGTTTKYYLYSSCAPWHLLYCIMLFMLFYVMLFMLFEAGMEVALCHLPPHSPMIDVIFDHSVFPTEPRLDLNIFSTHTPGSHYQLANQMAVACDMKPVFHPNSDGQLFEGQEPCLLHLCIPYSTYSCLRYRKLPRLIFHSRTLIYIHQTFPNNVGIQNQIRLGLPPPES